MRTRLLKYEDTSPGFPAEFRDARETLRKQKELLLEV
jgi:hypothetical protein